MLHIISSFRMRQHCIISPSSRNHSLEEGQGWQRFKSGGKKLGHSSIRCWSVCSGALHWQAADCRSPQRYMNTPKHPTPVRRWFKDTHSFLGSSAPGGRAVLGALFRCAGRDTCCQLVIHDSHMSNCEFTSLTACPRHAGKGWCDFKHCWPRRFDCSTKSWSRWLGDVKALVKRVWVWCSLRRGTEAMPESTGRSSVGVGRRHPVISLIVLFSVTSDFFKWELLHHAGDAYSAALRSKTFHFFVLNKFLDWTGRVFWVIVLIQYEALPNESGGILLNIGKQDGLYPSKWILLLLSCIKSSVKLRGPVPETAMHAHVMTPPPLCFTDEAVCLGSFSAPFFSPHFCFPIT